MGRHREAGPAEGTVAARRLLTVGVAGSAVTVVVGVVATLTLIWLVWLASTVIDESAVPPASFVPDLPAGAEIVQESESCGSGGCSLVLEVDPGDSTPAELATTLDLPQQVDSWFFDPRDIDVWPEVIDDRLVVSLTYTRPLA